MLRGRRAILDKLASVPVTSFDDADLGQLYQALILLDHPSAPRPPSSPALFLPVDGGTACKDVGLTRP